jgi:hypothetical protein
MQPTHRPRQRQPHGARGRVAVVRSAVDTAPVADIRWPVRTQTPHAQQCAGTLRHKTSLDFVECGPAASGTTRALPMHACTTAHACVHCLSMHPHVPTPSHSKEAVHAALCAGFDDCFWCFDAVPSTHPPFLLRPQLHHGVCGPGVQHDRGGCVLPDSAARHRAVTAGPCHQSGGWEAVVGGKGKGLWGGGWLLVAVGEACQWQRRAHLPRHRNGLQPVLWCVAVAAVVQANATNTSSVATLTRTVQSVGSVLSSRVDSLSSAAVAAVQQVGGVMGNTSLCTGPPHPTLP